MSTTNPSNPPTTKPLSILFVCLGNICTAPFSSPFHSTNHPFPAGRSPLSHALFLHHVAHLPPSLSRQFSTIDSAGTGAYHAHSAPDPRTISTLTAHGVTGYTHAARKVRRRDYDDFDYILAMDGENLEDLRALERRRGPAGRGRARVELFGKYGGGRGRKGAEDDDDEDEDEGEEVIDPYYGGEEGFEIVFEQADRFCRGFLREVLGDEYQEMPQLVDGKR